MRAQFTSRRTYLRAGLVVAALVAAACSGDHSALPTAVNKSVTSSDRGWLAPACPDSIGVPRRILQLFPRNTEAADTESYPQLDAHHFQAWRAIADFEFAVFLYRTGRVTEAQTIVAKLYNFIQQEYNAGALVGSGTPAGAAAVAALGQAMFCQVGITANISSNLNDNVVAIVPANTDTIIQTGTSNAGVQLFASQQLPQTVVIITRLPDTAHSANCPQYDGPLCTPLAQFPPYYYYQLNPAPQLGQSAPPFTVEECVDTTKVHVPLAQLYIGHDVSDTVQVLPKTPGTLGLACDPQTGMGPRRNMFELARKGDVSGAASELASRLEGLFVKTAYALETSSGVTGQTRSFSPFGIVDANDFVAYQNGGWTYHAPPTFTNPPPHDWGDVAGFQTPTYVPDGTWTLNTSPYGNAPFGSGSAGFGCALSALPNENLVWPSFNPVPGTTGNVDADSSTIFLLRANFYVPSTWSQDLNVGIAVDNDVEVFVNGTQVFVSPSQPPPTTSGLGFYVHEGCASQDSFVLDVPQALLLLGQKNLIAIRARDRGGESYIDARLSPATPVTPAP